MIDNELGAAVSTRGPKQLRHVLPSKKGLDVIARSGEWQGLADARIPRPCSQHGTVFSLPEFLLNLLPCGTLFVPSLSNLRPQGGQEQLGCLWRTAAAGDCFKSHTKGAPVPPRMMLRVAAALCSMPLLRDATGLTRHD